MTSKLDKSLKKELGASKSKEVDFNKTYFNGHKFFDAPQTKAFKELLKIENRTGENFEKAKAVLVKPRNPINGDPTPRDDRGIRVLNPNLHGTVKGGTLLFRENDSSPPRESLSRFAAKRPTEKIGITDGKYDILGRSGEMEVDMISSKAFFEATQTLHAKKMEVERDKETLNSMIMKQKAKRHEKELTRQLAQLQQQSAAKMRELEYIQQKYLNEEN
jgi:hypothetical protein